MRYALINIETGIVENVIELDNDTDWLPPEGYIVVRTDSGNINDTYNDGEFVTPPPPPPTPDEVLFENQQRQIYLLSLASQAMTPVLLSLQLGDATDEESAIARSWQAYYRSLQSVDLTVTSPDWPTPPSDT